MVTEEERLKSFRLTKWLVQQNEIIERYVSSAGGDGDGNDNGDNEEEDGHNDEKSKTQLPVDADDNGNDHTDNDRCGCDNLVGDSHEMMTTGMLSTKNEGR